MLGPYFKHANLFCLFYIQYVAFDLVKTNLT